jgi:predicted transcriptional regulator
VAGLRTGLYRRLAPIAHRWRAALGSANDAFPLEHGEFLARCHAAGQTRPTPRLLRYGQGDYNRLHRDLYGAIAFPLQVVILLSKPERDFDGGELVLTEQSPRRQSRAHVVPLVQGDGVVFAVSERPSPGARGFFRVTMRHGVSAVRSGVRHTLGCESAWDLGADRCGAALISLRLAVTSCGADSQFFEREARAMSVLTIRLPDDQHERLKALAAHRGVSMNKLVDELATRAVAEFDTEVRFRARAARGDAAAGLALLDKLDAAFKAEN